MRGPQLTPLTAKEAKRVEKRRARNEAKAQEMLKRAAKMGLLEPKYRPRRESHPTEATSQWTDLARFGPLDILNETPPPSAIVGRRDTADALSLLQMSLRMRELESGVQKQRRSRLNFRRAPHQSAAERQVRDDDASHVSRLRFSWPAHPLTARLAFRVSISGLICSRAPRALARPSPAKVAQPARGHDRPCRQLRCLDVLFRLLIVPSPSRLLIMTPLDPTYSSRMQIYHPLTRVGTARR